MNNEVRKYVFDGKLGKRCNELLDGSSDERQMYVAMGHVRYMGKCESGGACEIPIREEPSDVRTLFPDSRGVRKKAARKSASSSSSATAATAATATTNADDNSEGSQAVEDNRENNATATSTTKPSGAASNGRKARRKMTAAELNTFQARKWSTIIVRDTGRLILPHVGMHIYAHLRRAELRPHVAVASGDYHDYIYDIVTVLSFKSAIDRPDEAAFVSTLPTPEHLVAYDIAEARVRGELARLRIDKTSSMGHEAAKRKRDMMSIPLLNGTERLELAKISTPIAEPAHWRLFSTLRSMCAFMRTSLGTNPTRLDAALQSFRGLYAARFNQTLCLFNESLPAQKYRSKLGHMTKVLSLNSAYDAGRTIASASFRELLALTDAIAARRSTAPHCVVFTSAMLLLPVWYLQNGTRLLSRFEGVYWNWRQRESGMTRRMVEYSRLLVPRAPPDEEIGTALAAQRVHRAIVRHLRTFAHNTMVEVYQLVSDNDRLRAEVGDRHSDVLRNALTFLLGCGALCAVPRRTVERAASLNRLLLSYAPRQQREAHMQPLLVCTRQQWRISNALVASLRKLLPQLRFAAQTSGGFVQVPPSSAVERHALFIYCATVPRFVGTSRVAAIHLATLLGRAQECDNDSQHLVEMMSFNEFVLCDTHLLGEPALLQFLEFMARHRDALGRAPITLMGDCALSTPFSTLYDSNSTSRHVPLLLRDSRTTWPLHDVMQELRHHCALSGIENGSMQRFVKALATQRHLPWTRVVESVLNNEERRMIVVAKSNRVYFDVLRKLRDSLTPIADASRRDNLYTAVRPLRDILTLVCDGGDQDLLRSHVLFASPFIGLTAHRVCAHIERFYMLREVPPPGHTVLENMCVALRPTARCARSAYNEVPIEAVSLDNGLLLVRLENSFATTGIDHTWCCGTWHRDVMHVARHRNELVSQSLCNARDALPLDECEYSPLVLFGAEYQFPDVYAALVRATPSLRKKLQLVDCALPQMPQWLMSHYRKPSTFLGDLLK